MAEYGFADTVEPTIFLKPPVRVTDDNEGDKFSRGDFIDGFNQMSDFVSPTYWLTRAIEHACGENPLNKVLEVFAGNWREFFECGEAWENLSKSVEAMAGNVESGNKSLDASWDGNAADAAFVYFREFGVKLDELRSSLDTLSTSYKNISQGLYAIAQRVRTVLLAIGDRLIVIAVEFMVGFATSWTGVGAVASAGLIALEVVRISKLWGDMTKCIGDAQNMLNVAVGVLATTGESIHSGFVKFPVPGQTYDHPNAKI